MTRTAASTVATAALVLSALVLSACGVPTDAAPRPIPENDQLVALEQVSGASSADAPAGSPVIFLVDPSAERLVAVRRDVRREARSALEALFAGPNQSDLDAKRSTEIPEGVDVLETTRVAPDGLVVALRVEPDTPGFQAQSVLGLAQVVYTATSLRCVHWVRFTINGVPNPLFDEDNTPKDGPLRRSDFASKRPPMSATEERMRQQDCSTP